MIDFLPVCRCDECDLFPIVGPRYKCQKCANYDMCENCFRIKKHKHNHVFTKIPEPGNLICKAKTVKEMF